MRTKPTLIASKLDSSSFKILYDVTKALPYLFVCLDFIIDQNKQKGL